ncbi:MAG: hypothetical protein HYU57_06410 [Micavibrio aeruginosavorus]|nr:hypothetical protein [Micavibrio aeruginosavorus]
MAIKSEFGKSALGVPDLNDGSWLVADMSGKGLFVGQQQQPAAAPEQTVAAKPQKLDI